MRISDWSSTCALPICQFADPRDVRKPDPGAIAAKPGRLYALENPDGPARRNRGERGDGLFHGKRGMQLHHRGDLRHLGRPDDLLGRSEEHTSELQSIMRISYAVFSLTKKTIDNKH